jgi:hypothetical protein
MLAIYNNNKIQFQQKLSTIYTNPTKGQRVEQTGGYNNRLQQLERGGAEG